MRALAAMLTCLVAASTAAAHPLAPSLLELREGEDGRRHAVRWRTPLRTAGRIAPTPELPAACRALGPPRESVRDGGLERHWEVDCGGSLVGRSLAVRGLAESRTDAVVHVLASDGSRLLRDLLHAGRPALVVPPRASRGDVLRAYAGLGVRHIATGWDHLLFVFGLALLVRRPRAIGLAVTGFTAGHSITLALAALQLVRVPSGPVEVAIAGSLLWLGVELARPPDDTRSRRRRAALLSAPFGLLHGLGFAGALREAGLPAGEVPAALVAFNLGIEAGQLAFVAALFGLARAATPLAPLVRRAPPWTARAPAYGVGSLAAYWCFERASALF